jgi:hypothetical protein
VEAEAAFQLPAASSFSEWALTSVASMSSTMRFRSGRRRASPPPLRSPWARAAYRAAPRRSTQHPVGGRLRGHRAEQRRLSAQPATSWTQSPPSHSISVRSRTTRLESWHQRRSRISATSDRAAVRPTRSASSAAAPPDVGDHPVTGRMQASPTMPPSPTIHGRAEADGGVGVPGRAVAVCHHRSVTSG